MSSTASVYQCCGEQHLYAVTNPQYPDSFLFCRVCGMAWEHSDGREPVGPMPLPPDILARARAMIEDD